jgi:hypothetical protein
MAPEVTSWTTDYDIFDTEYVANPYPIWDEMRETCPIAHTDQHGGSWLPTTYEHVTAIARDVEHFSSRDVSVMPPAEGQADVLPAGQPPISQAWRALRPRDSRRKTRPDADPGGGAPRSRRRALWRDGSRRPAAPRACTESIR